MTAAVAGVVVRGRIGPRYSEILTADALAFLAELHRRFDGKRRELLAARAERQKRFDAGVLPDFPPETKYIRDDDSWRVAPIPPDLTDRRVEITGPVDRKMIVNALNSGATHYMADFEDANSPTWANNLEGQINLKDRWAGKIDFTDPATRKRYAVRANPAVLIVRPRGWHLPEAHLTVDGAPLRARCSTSGFTSSTTPGRCWRKAPVPISICPSSKTPARRGCGTTCSCSRKSSSVCRHAASRPPC